MHLFRLRSLRFISPIFLIVVISCSSSDTPEPVDCSLSDLVVEATGQNPTSCSSNNGTITAIAAGGKEPYKFAINTGSFSTSPTFNNLGGGSYTVRVKDKNGCENSTDVSLEIPGADPLSAITVSTPDKECVDNNGSLEVIASGGVPPYQYKIGAGAFSDAAIFNSLAPGNYSIAVKDATDCVFTKGASVGKGDSQTSLALDIKPIIETECAITNCHNGSQSPDLRSSSNIISNASQIKSETQSGAMPKDGNLDSSQKALIACWVEEGAKNN
jgi:hypothetical protein